MKKTWNRLYDKVSKIDTADFTVEEMEKNAGLNGSRMQIWAG